MRGELGSLCRVYWSDVDPVRSGATTLAKSPRSLNRDAQSPRRVPLSLSAPALARGAPRCVHAALATCAGLGRER
ncbi:unnamed protein product [Lampetra fluviatilis]